ncbi:hypothetical protein NDU88_005065 [Pleurodeles waltl]|uniref:Uncharacterized protein n=1 Tax=Pleurodeles waltl TaxID=8319 RepID=A0AAV7VKF4_PLEWA|nr:hypothetical protein NDU88_005065 [Pleurodeles waltl]
MPETPALRSGTRAPCGPIVNEARESRRGREHDSGCAPEGSWLARRPSRVEGLASGTPALCTETRAPVGQAVITRAAAEGLSGGRTLYTGKDKPHHPDWYRETSLAPSRTLGTRRGQHFDRPRTGGSRWRRPGLWGGQGVLRAPDDLEARGETRRNSGQSPDGVR